MDSPKNTGDLFRDVSELAEFYIKHIGKEHTANGLMIVALMNVCICANFTEKGMRCYVNKCLDIAKDLTKDLERKFALEELKKKGEK